MPFFRAIAIRLGRWRRVVPPAGPTPEQSKLRWADGLLASAVAQSQCGQRDWTSPGAYQAARGMPIGDDFEQFVVRLRAMSDEDVTMAYRCEGGEGPRAQIIAAEMRRRNKPA